MMLGTTNIKCHLSVQYLAPEYLLSDILPLPPLGVLFSLKDCHKRVNYWPHCCQSSSFNIKHPTPRKSEGKVFPAHAMNAQRRSKGTAPLILDLGTTWEVCGQVHAQATLSREQSPHDPINEAGCTPERTWTFLTRENSLSPIGNRTADHPAHRLITIQSTPTLRQAAL